MRQKLTAIMLLLTGSLQINAQNEVDTSVTLDMLSIPNSPAFQLLEISPSAIDHPNTPADFAFSLTNATNNFSAIPKNFAIEFLPVSLFKNANKSYEKFTNSKTATSETLTTFEKLKNNISNTLIISSGFTTDESVETSIDGYIKTRSGNGFKVSLVRGKIDTEFEEYKDNIDSIRTLLAQLHQWDINRIDSIRNSDLIYFILYEQREKIKQEIRNRGGSNDSLLLELKNINTNLEQRLEAVKKELKNEITVQAAELKREIEKLKFKRYGWMLDLAGGIVLGFRNDDIQNSIVQQWAMWLNGGYSSKKGFTFLGLIRSTTNIDAIYDAAGNTTNLNLFDLGGRLEYMTTDNKLMLSGEAIIRFNSQDNSNVNRYSINASYQVGKNQSLTFAIGKAFSGPVQTGGNLIAALNYIKSFGTSRTLVPDVPSN